MNDTSKDSDMNQTTNNDVKYIVAHGGELFQNLSSDAAMKKADELHKKYGGVPTMSPMEGTGYQAAQDLTVMIAKTPERASNVVELKARSLPQAIAKTEAEIADEKRDTADGYVSAAGKLRSMLDKAAAEEAGFAPKQTIYERGRVVNSIGVENATRSRMEHDAKPLVRDYCLEFKEKIQSEEREDYVVTSTDLVMSDKGLLYTPDDRDFEWALAERAFPSFLARTKIGGADYLRRCWPELRAKNVNEWLETMKKFGVVSSGDEEIGPTEIKLRTRLNQKAGARSGREIFAAVGPKYQDYDVDIVAEALALATPPEARGTVTYDGYKTRFEVMFHTDVKPKDFVAGEFFKAGVIISTDDTGGGSLQGSSAVFQNLCLNLIIIDTMESPLFRIRHLGSVHEIADKFKEGFRNALKKIDYFLNAWGYAVHDDLTKGGVYNVEDAHGHVPVTVEELMSGLFHGIVEKELVPVKGKAKDVVPQLMKMWTKDESAAAGTTRAAVVNAFTRYAHEAPLVTPWEEDDIQKSVSGLLYGKRNTDGSRKKPAALPWLEFDGGRQSAR